MYLYIASVCLNFLRKESWLKNYTGTVKTECHKIWKFRCVVIQGLNLLQAALGKQEISRKTAADTGEESEGSNDDAYHSDDDDDDQHSQGDKVKL
jgi:hypothetical protein